MTMTDALPLRAPTSLADTLSGAFEVEQDMRCDDAQAAAVMLSAASGFDDVTPQRAAKMAQGTLKSLYELAQISCEFSGLATASLAALSAEQAEFASLSMIIKYHQRQRQPRQQLLVCGELPQVLQLAGDMGLETSVVTLDQLGDALSDKVAAVVFAASALSPENLPSTSLIERIQQQGILLHLSASQRYFVAYPALRQFDSISLDLSLLCGVDTACLALLASQKLSAFLPVPLVSNDEGAFEWRGLQQNPFSIGYLNSSAGNISALLQCLVKLSLLGLDQLQQQAQKAVASACYVAQRLSDEGFSGFSDADQAAGRYRFTLQHEAAAIEAVQVCLAPVLAQGVSTNSRFIDNGANLEITLERLHHLTRAQLDELLQNVRQQLAAFVVNPE